MKRLVLSVSCAVALILLSSCGAGEQLMRPLYRFASPQPAAEGQRQLATATILDETRYVLSGHKRGLLMSTKNVSIPSSGRLSMRVRLPLQLSHGSRVVTHGRARGRHGWIPLPQTVVNVEKQDGKAFVQLELELPRDLAGATADLNVEGSLAHTGEYRAHTTPTVEIPSGARLEFGIGILEPASREGPVEFSVQACQAGTCEPIFTSRLDTLLDWQDHVVPLVEYAGRTVSFRFETRLLRPTPPQSFSMAVWSNPTVYAPAARNSNDINIILLSVDTLRADHLPTYGYSLDTAPFIDDKFGDEGAVFEHLVAAEATTGPTHMSMFTSLQPSVHGLVGGPQVLPSHVVTLAEALRAHGFETGAITENGALIVGRGYERGFNSFAENKSSNMFLPRGQIDRTLTEARRWLRRHADKRFFLFLHTYQVHYPYAPPPAYRDLFASAAEGHALHPSLPPNRRPELYDREIRYVDDELRSFFNMLEEEGFAENTLFILTSDHGEEFLEHGFLGHGPHVHAEISHVPLMFFGPGVPAGLRVESPVAQIDLMPTILELAGAPAVQGGMGRSFADLLRGLAHPDSFVPGPVYSEAWYRKGHMANERVVQILQPTFAVRIGDRKLIRYRQEGGFRYEYFDLRTDPREAKDRYEKMKSELGDLRALIDSYPKSMASLKAELARGGRNGVREGDREEIAIDPAREEKLRALGYLD